MDRDLVERGRRGDREAYELLAQASVRRLYGVAHRILRDADAADDATQQALVAIWLELPKLRDPERFEAWTYRLVVRASLAIGRNERRRTIKVGRLFTPEVESPDDATSVELRDQLERAFRELTPEHRAIIVLHRQVGLPLTEVADILGIPYGTAGSRLHYALQRLRVAFDQQDEPARPGKVPA